MNSRGQFERELRQLVELNKNNESSSEAASGSMDVWSRAKYYAAQESFMAHDIPSAFKHLILNYTNRLGTLLQQQQQTASDGNKRPYVIESLETLVANDLKLNLVVESSNLAKSLHNDFFLSLVTNTQSLLEWFASKSSSDEVNRNDENLMAGRVNTCYLLNNLGILNFALKKYAMGCLLSKKALHEARRLLSSDQSETTRKSSDENARADSFAINRPLLGNTALVKVSFISFQNDLNNLF